MNNIIRMVLGFSLGVMLTVMGFSLYTWQFWVVIAIVIISNGTFYIDGLNDD